MNACRQPATAIPRDPHRGFALVITLALMVLLTLIAVGLLSLSSISLRASNTSQALDTARQNARVALVLAIGELQRYAGQDQRITATADIASAANGLPLAAGKPPLNDKSINKVAKGLSALQPGTRYWTGVFANSDNPVSVFTKTPSPTIVHWLVSGNTTAYPAGGSSILPADATCAVGPDGALGNVSQAVVLVGKNSVGSGPESIHRYVAVPWVDVFGKDSAKPAGRFAWWVGDEGVKAKINGAKTLEDKANYAALTAQRRGWETVDGFAAYPTPDVGPHAALPKIITLGETALLIPGLRAEGNGASPLQQVFHSATTESRAVLTDPLNGGTKIDLTAILAGTLPSSKAVFTIPNYPVKRSNIIPKATAPSMKAPTWDALKDFHDRAKSLENGSLICKAATSDTTAAIAPLITDIRFLFGAKIIKNSLASFKVNACGKIAVTLANPYSCPLKWNSDLEIEMIAAPLNVRLSCIWELGANTAFLPRNAAEPAVFNKALFRIRPATLAPGEARAFTNAGHVYRSRSTGAANTAVDLATVVPSTVGDFNNCIELENPSTIAITNPGARDIPGLGVLEEWQTSCATVVMRFAGATNILRQIDRFELDTPQFRIAGSIGGGATNDMYVRRSFTNAEATQITAPFPLLCHSFQISQPGEDYRNYMPADFGMGQRSSTLRTFADFNLQATRLRKPIASYNPLPYFTEWTNSMLMLPPSQPLRSTDHGGETGTTFTRNLATSTFRWGRSHTNGSAKTILFSIPSQIASIAQLQHADLTGDDKFASIGHQPGNAVGNSYATPFVKRSLVSQSRTDYLLTGTSLSDTAAQTPANYYDISYLLNAALWDSYFFSTIPRTGSSTPENPSLIQIDPNVASDQLKDPVKAASRLMLDGAFNCNSTDKNAWKAFLASAKHFKHAADTASNNDAAFPRSLEQISTSASPPTGNDADSFSGFRRLTDAQLDDLAGEIVKQVRLRGPFVSLSHFVNRALAELKTQPALTRCGALQSAIDESGANINFSGSKCAFLPNTVFKPLDDKVTLLWKQGAPRADYDVTGNIDVQTAFRPADASPAHPDWAVVSGGMNYGNVGSIVAEQEMLRDTKYKPEQGYRSTGIPGWLTQADVLQLIGPSLTTRSDTFRIRTCGEALDSNGVATARVYCEALVQRVPAYIDPTNAPSARGAELSTLNQTYGRQFQIIAFRWLSPDEI